VSEPCFHGIYLAHFKSAVWNLENFVALGENSICQCIIINFLKVYDSIQGVNIVNTMRFYMMANVVFPIANFFHVCIEILSCMVYLCMLVVKKNVNNWLAFFPYSYHLHPCLVEYHLHW